MKKQLCILVSLTLSAPLYAEPNTVPAPIANTSFEPGKFNHATLSLSYETTNKIATTRILTPADPAIQMTGESTAMYLTQDTIKWFSRDMTIGMLIGIVGGVVLFGAGSWFLSRLQAPRAIAKKTSKNDNVNSSN